ncbi:MAG: hypothetical protein JST86_13730 [Bacteroidetes bacterium]|nr:hypothetical protein [Bacteroidota bacterium]
MKQLILFPVVLAGMSVPGNITEKISPQVAKHSAAVVPDDGGKYLQLGNQNDKGSTRMPAVAFKAQQYCRAELKDFEYDVHFDVVSASVYFSGAGFDNVTTSAIKGNSLANIRSLMDRCKPGSVISFDNVKVVGPDKEVRSIDGITIVLF